MKLGKIIFNIHIYKLAINLSYIVVELLGSWTNWNSMIYTWLPQKGFLLITMYGKTVNFNMSYPLLDTYYAYFNLKLHKILVAMAMFMPNCEN